MPRVKRNQTSKNIKKAGDKLGFAKFDIINMTVPQSVEEVTNSNGIKTPYVPFGANNLFPEYLAEVTRKSPTHRAILGQKKILSVGKEFQAENELLMSYVDRVNPNESLRDIYGKIMADYYTFGNAYIELVTYEGGVNLYHVDATFCRLSKDQKQVYIHPDWKNYQSTKKDTVILDMYPKFRGNRAIIHIKDYEPTFSYYGLPDFIAALKWLNIDHLLQSYNNTKFEQNFMPSAIVEINGDMGQEEAEQLVKEAQNKWTGEGNNSKILFLVKNGDTSPANITMLQDTADGSFMDLQRLTSQNIITAHRWQPAMSGIINVNKLNSTGNEIRVAWEMVMGTIIKDVEGLILRKIRDVIDRYMPFSADDLEIVYEPPVSYLADIEASTILTLNEQRVMLGFDPLDEGGDVLLTKKTTN
tara:strand:- start:13209 stop:14453 length:1245 start_codon:yes stop_codon:yes gene_type:complete